MTELSDRPRGLKPFEGHAVVRAGMEVPGAAGGLRDPLQADPVELHLDDEVFVVFHLRTNKVRFDPVKDSEDDYTRVHVMEVVNATFVDQDLVAHQLGEQSRRIAAAKRAADAAKGIQELPLGGEEPPVNTDAELDAAFDQARAEGRGLDDEPAEEREEREERALEALSPNARDAILEARHEVRCSVVDVLMGHQGAECTIEFIRQETGWEPNEVNAALQWTLKNVPEIRSTGRGMYTFGGEPITYRAFVVNGNPAFAGGEAMTPAPVA